jgi:hypothetical protein
MSVENLIAASDYAVSLVSDLPIDNPGSKTITVQDFFSGTAAENTFSCVSYAYTGLSEAST